MTESTGEASVARLVSLPSDLHVNILTYLRAYDLGNVQQTCKLMANPRLIHEVVQHFATQVYPSELTMGWHDECTFEGLRKLEWIVVAAAISRPEPKTGFYVSKQWCRTTLKYLEVQEYEQEKKQRLANVGSSGKKKGKKLSKKQERMRSRRLSDANPPWPNMNADLLCGHMALQHVGSQRTAKARRRLMDKQAWKMLKRLYPESVALPSREGECLQCKLEQETVRRNMEKQAMTAKEERKKCLGDPLVRAIYMRPSKGVPLESLKSEKAAAISGCPMAPGLYHVLPRAWLHQWRRFLKTGEGGPVPPPDASSLLCVHRIPLLPPHLEDFLYGETRHLFETKQQAQKCLMPRDSQMQQEPEPARRSIPPGMRPLDGSILNDLRAAGLSEAELSSQMEAMWSLQESQVAARAPVHMAQPNRQASVDKEQLDRENRIVVEILTDDEYCALEKWWPSHSKFSLKFSVMHDDSGGTDIQWSTYPCRSCDASSKSYCTPTGKNRTSHRENDGKVYSKKGNPSHKSLVFD